MYRAVAQPSEKYNTFDCSHEMMKVRFVDNLEKRPVAYRGVCVLK